MEQRQENGKEQIREREERRSVCGVGDMLGEKYRLEAVIGSGGMGTVYRAWDNRLEKYWAVKVLKNTGKEALVRKSLLAECEVLRQAKHAFFPGIVDLLETEEQVCLVMDLIEGESLEERLRRSGRLDPETAMDVMEQLADALQCLHQMCPPRYYLDLKPSNVMLEADGTVRIIDFGSVVSDRGEGGVPWTATPGYAPPEQRFSRAGGRKVDERSDIYSLGKTAYAMLTGRSPAGPPYGAVGIRQQNQAVPGRLEQIVERCMEEEKEDRYQTVQEVKEALFCYRYLEETEKEKRRRAWLQGSFWLGLTVLQAAAGGWFKKAGNTTFFSVYPDFFGKGMGCVTFLLALHGWLRAARRERILPFELQRSVGKTRAKVPCPEKPIPF